MKYFLQHFPFGNFAKVYYHNILLKEIQTTLFALSRRGTTELFCQVSGKKIFWLLIYKMYLSLGLEKMPRVRELPVGLGQGMQTWSGMIRYKCKIWYLNFNYCNDVLIFYNYIIIYWTEGKMCLWKLAITYQNALKIVLRLIRLSCPITIFNWHIIQMKIMEPQLT